VCRRCFRRSIATLTGTLLVAAAAIGCTPAPDPAPTVPTTPSTSTTPSPTPTGPALVPDGTAEDNLPLFRQVIETVAAEHDGFEGRVYIDALVAAGFDKSAMEVTRDRTTVDDPADSIQFSVLWHQECLVGQVGPSTPAPTAVILPELPSGGCLVGDTRDIDW